MTTLTIRDAVGRAAEYPYAIASFVDAEGYPMTVAAPFSGDSDAGTVVVGPIAAAEIGRAHV